MNPLKALSSSLCLAAVLTFSSAAYAHDEHKAGTITGAGIQLFERDHGFAGHVLDRPVFGAFEHEPFGAKVQIRKGEKIIALELVSNDSQYAGVLSEVREDEKTGGKLTVETKVEFVKVKKTGEAEGMITLKLDGAEVTVQVTGKTFANGHFQAPSFKTTLNGKEVSFAFTGEACFGYSSNLSMMILGAYAHLQK
ncbi:MAG: hypothetical protein AB7P04_10545 [Bacteriovoracia bacterium]